MHYLVKLIVMGENADEALKNAVVDADSLVERGYFDWYDVNGRWGDSEAHRVNSPAGRALIRDGMEANRKDFDDALRHIRYMLENYADTAIYNEEFGGKKDDDISYLSRYQFEMAAGSKAGAYVYAVDGSLWGDKINHDVDLDEVIGLDGEDNKLWVVPIDFHN